MIDFFFGKPRSGKSYRAVKLIYDDYLKDLNNPPKFRNILTNVGGFKFDKVNQMFSDNGSSSQAYKLSWKSFYIHLKKMYEMALDEKSDEELNKYADYHIINDCLIVLDEASLYMKKYDDVISWWLAYHGHFRVRIVIIAQGPKQINPEYMTHTEIFYEAQPQAKQLRDNQLRYIHHSEVPFNKDSKFSSDTINTSPELYALYKSGEVDKPRKIIYKFIVILFLGALFSFSAFYYLFYSLGQRTTEENEVNNVQENQFEYQSNQPDTEINTNKKDLINFRCNSKYCWIVDDKYKYNEVSLTYLKFIILKHDIELEFSEIKNKVYKTTLERRGSSISTVSKMTDYYYFISKEIQNSYFSNLFILKKQKKDKKLSISNPFSSDKTSLDSGANEQRRAP